MEAIAPLNSLETTKRKPGRPVERTGLIVEIIDRHYQGDRAQASQAWEIAPRYLNNLISGGAQMSRPLAYRIHLATREPLPALLSLRK